MDLIVILLSFLHPLNAFCLIRIRFDPAVLPMLIAGIFAQPANALIPIPSTLSGKVIGVLKPVHPWNAPNLIVVTFLPKVIVDRFVHPENA